jgi:prophage regulatory protein
MTEPQLQRVYRSSELPAFCGLQRTQIAELIAVGQFPRPVPLSDTGRAVGWLESDLVLWQAKRIAARDATRTDKGAA